MSVTHLVVSRASRADARPLSRRSARTDLVTDVSAARHLGVTDPSGKTAQGARHGSLIGV